MERIFHIQQITAVHRHSFFLYLLTLFLTVFPSSSLAQQDGLKAMRNAVPGTYNFWVYAPAGSEVGEPLPLVVFLHGASLCGNDLNRVLRYGPLDAVKRGVDLQAVVVAPQNSGGQWNTEKIDCLLEWTLDNYNTDPARVYVLGMSLGGYGTLDFCALYPEKVAAAMALCGGTTLREYDGLEDVPLWIIHGTGDSAVPVSESQKIVDHLRENHLDSRLRYDWLPGGSHGEPSRYFYLPKTYEWLFAHSLRDRGRPLNRKITISRDELRDAFR